MDTNWLWLMLKEDTVCNWSHPSGPTRVGWIWDSRGRCRRFHGEFDIVLEVSWAGSIALSSWRSGGEHSDTYKLRYSFLGCQMHPTNGAIIALLSPCELAGVHLSTPAVSLWSYAMGNRDFYYRTTANGSYQRDIGSTSSNKPKIVCQWVGPPTHREVVVFVFF